MTTARRTRKGAGSVTKRADGRWHGRFTRPDGSRGHVYGQTKDEASRKLAVAMRQAEDGAGPLDERLTVAAFLARFLEAVRPQVRATTHTLYEYHCRVHLVPALGRVKLAKLTAAHVDAMMANLLASDMNPATANRIRATLRRALGQAADWGLVRENVVKRTKAAKERPYHAQPLTADHARQFLAATSEDRLAALWALALGTGMRQGEALALTWDAVDLGAGTAHVDKTLQRPRDGSGGWRLEPPKSKRARRTVNLPTFAIAALHAHRAAQNREKLAGGGAWAEGDFVFTTTRGTPLDGSNVTHRLQRALAKADLPRQRFHDLRHAAASLLLAQGADLRTVMEVLGHSSITLTANTYAHVGRAALKDAAAKLDAALGGS